METLTIMEEIELLKTLSAEERADIIYGEEEWRVIPSHPNFEASSFGRIRSQETKKIRRCTAPPGGRHVRVTLDGIASQRSSLIAEAFLEPEKEICIVHHANGDCNYDRYGNLEYLTRSEHSIEHLGIEEESKYQRFQKARQYAALRRLANATGYKVVICGEEIN